MWPCKHNKLNTVQSSQSNNTPCLSKIRPANKAVLFACEILPVMFNHSYAANSSSRLYAEAAGLDKINRSLF